MDALDEFGLEWLELSLVSRAGSLVSGLVSSTRPARDQINTQ
mgnify:FL=1